MDYDFLPSKPAPPKPNTSEGTGGTFSVGKNVFYDFYFHHLDLHNLFSTPPIKSEFNLIGNFEVAEEYFSKYNLTDNLDWIAEGTTYNELIAGYTQFQNPKLLNEILDKLNNEISADLFSGIEKPKMKINDRFGMFSFDLASMQMTYVFEYYNKKGIKVDANYIVKKGNDFYFENEKVEQRIKRRKNGTPVVVSSVRNCLIDFEKKEKEQRAVEIFVQNTVAGSVDYKSFLYNSMSAISVAQNLILKGFKVKVTCVLISSYKDVAYFHFVPTKRFNQPLDLNATAYVCGDTRFYRYQGLKAYLSGYDKENVVGDSGFGKPINDKKMVAQIIEKDYVPNSKLKQADTRLYFGGARSMSDVKKEVIEALEILNEKYGGKKN